MIRGEPLRQPVVGEDARPDDGGQIPGTELIDGRMRNRLRRQCRLAIGNRAVHEDDDQPPFLGHVVRDHLVRRVPDPGRRRRSARGLGRGPRQVHDGKRHHRPRLPVGEDGEVRGGQAANRLPVLVEHGNIDRNQIRPAVERGSRRRWSLLRVERKDDWNEDGTRETNEHDAAHRSLPGETCWVSAVYGIATGLDRGRRSPAAAITSDAPPGVVMPGAGSVPAM